jgi:hypothetical protein
MEPNTLLALSGTKRPRTVSGHPNLRKTRSGWIAPTGLGDPFHLACESGPPPESIRVDAVHKNRRAPALNRIRTMNAREPPGQHFDEQRESRSLVTSLEPAQWQDRPRRVRAKYTRIIRRIPVTIQ